MFLSSLSKQTQNNISKKINGLTFVAPPDPFPRDPMPAITNLHANWIALVPYAFTSIKDADLHYAENNWQWWGERPEGIQESIRKAREHHLSIMLKPQVYIPNSWVGDMDYNTEEQWTQWESKYREYILRMLDIAKENNVALFCIGTEFNKSVIKRKNFWHALIQEVRSIYSGKITYSTNWDHYHEVSFWGELDYIGISAYFPLSDESNPSKKTLLNAWTPIRQQLKDFAAMHHKPILFTEYGYLSVDGCAGKLWEIEPIVRTKAINQQAQATALDALYESFWNEDYWAGGFLWKWFPNGHGHEGYIERDYTPQGKLAERTISKWFSK